MRHGPEKKKKSLPAGGDECINHNAASNTPINRGEGPARECARKN